MVIIDPEEFHVWFEEYTGSKTTYLFSELDRVFDVIGSIEDTKNAIITSGVPREALIDYIEIMLKL